MAFIVVDLEFNNLDGIGKYYPNIMNDYKELENINLNNEIIEIGAIKLDNYMKPIKEYKAYIKPSVFPILNPKISEITNITEVDLESGVTFNEGIEGLRDLIDDGDIICSWAKDDIIEIINNSIYKGYDDISWIKKYLDLQEYSTKMLGKKKSLSLKHALEDLKIKIDNSKLHDALNDAIYTSLVLKRLYNLRILKNYIITDINSIPAIEIKNLEEYDIDFSKVNQRCPKCNIKLNIEYDFKPIKWRFVSMGECPRCKNKMVDELIVKKTFNGEDVYKEIIRIVDEIEYINYSYKMK